MKSNKTQRVNYKLYLKVLYANMNYNCNFSLLVDKLKIYVGKVRFGTVIRTLLVGVTTLGLAGPIAIDIAIWINLLLALFMSFHILTS